jgi:UDP-glucose 4-epimerase
MLAIEKLESVCKVFNLGSGKGLSIKELATMLVKMSNKNLDIVYDNPEEGAILGVLEV